MAMAAENLTQQKPAPLPLRPPKIAHGTAWERTRASMVRHRRLTVSDGAAEPVAVSVDG